MRRDELWIYKNGAIQPVVNAPVLFPANQYLEFGSVSGSGGYGFRDNAGVLEFKNSGGTWEPFGSGTGVGTVTSVSVVSANGLAGSVASPTTTPAITLSTTVTGILKGNGTAISAATAGTDYLVPASGLTVGSVLFANGSGQVSQDNSNFYWDATNKRLGIGIGTSPAEAFDLNGVVRGTNGITNSTNKHFHVVDRHYLNAEEDVSMLYMVSQINSNILRIGGGAVYNAATAIHFYTAANYNTVGGTARLSIDSSGNVTVVSLTNGLVKSASGVLSNATAGTDYQAPITLTTTGTSGAATFIANTLNIPQYTDTTYTAGTGLTLSTNQFSLTAPVTIALGGTNKTSQTTNGVAYYSGTQITTGTAIVFDGTNLGIAQTTPTQKLHITGNAIVSGWITVANDVYGAGWNGLFEVPTKHAVYAKIQTLGPADIGLSASVTELNYVVGVTSAIQTQLNGKQGTITLTTTGTSGAATLIGNTLNIPQYTAGTGTVTSVGLTVPAFLSVSGSPVTTSGTFAVTLSGTALPVANGGTGITSFGTGIATWLGTPSSANLLAAITDETGTGALVFANTPTLVTPVIGAATGTSVVLSGAGNPLDVTNTTNATSNLVGKFSGANSTRANNDFIYQSYFLANSAGTQKEFARQKTVIESVTNSLEIGQIQWSILTVGTLVDVMALTTNGLEPTVNNLIGLGTATKSWADLFLASGAVLNFANGNAAITHSSGILTVSTGDLRVTTAGTNSASAVTVGGTQTLTNKTLTTPVINVGSDATGDIYYRSAGGAFTRLGVGSNGDILTLASGLPSWATPGGGTGTVTTVSVVSANGFAGSVATATTTPAITISTSITGVLKGNGTAISAATAGTDYTTPSSTETVTNKDLTSGTNTFPTFNQNTTGSAAKWTTARNLAGNSVDGSGNVAFANKFIVQGTSDAGLSAAQFLGALGTGIVKNTTTTGVLSIAVAGDFPTLNQSTTGSAATLTTPRAIYGNNFDGSAALTQIIASTYGGTGNGFTKFSGPTTSEKTKTLRDANDTILELGGNYTPTGTWTSMTLVTPALGTPASGTLTNATGLPIAGLVASTSTAIGVGSIELGHASDTTIARVSAGVISVEGVTVVLNASSPTLGTITTTGNIELGHASDTTISRVSAGLIAVEGVNVVTVSASQALTNKSVNGVTLVNGGTSTLYLSQDGTYTAPSGGGGGGGLTWNEVTGTSQTAAVDNGYITNNAGLVTVTLPATAAVGKVVRVAGKGAGGWRIAQNASGLIHFGNLDTTTGTGGRLDSVHQNDAVELVCIVANNEWLVISSVGNITVT